MESDLSFVYMTCLLIVLYNLMKYHKKYLKGFKSHGLHKIKQLWEITPEMSQLELLFLNMTHLLNVLYNLIKYHDYLVIAAAQDFITMGDNSRTQSVRVVILVRDTPTQCPLPIGEVSWK